MAKRDSDCNPQSPALSERDESKRLKRETSAEHVCPIAPTPPLERPHLAAPGTAPGTVAPVEVLIPMPVPHICFACEVNGTVYKYSVPKTKTLQEAETLAKLLFQLDNDSTVHMNVTVPETPYAAPYTDRQTDDSWARLRGGAVVHVSVEAKREWFSITIKTPSGESLEARVLSTSSIGRLQSSLEKVEGIPEYDQRLFFEDCRLHSHERIGECDIGPGDTLELRLASRGGKPVIYLFPTNLLPSAVVTTTLSPQWQFSATYPHVDTRPLKSGSSSVSWTVSAKPSGRLRDSVTDLELDYLFWEAESTGAPVLDNDLPFNPSAPDLSPCNAVVMSYARLLPYLDGALRTFTLHVAARNDFITYWIAAFHRLSADNTRDIAIRFLPQYEYEKAAQLDVSPRPDVVTRVFMLFGGVEKKDTAWNEARVRVKDIEWRQVVGVKDEADDPSRFRVLEWGGMEVPL